MGELEGMASRMHEGKERESRAELVSASAMLIRWRRLLLGQRNSLNHTQGGVQGS
jgi:hypothetical protein